MQPGMSVKSCISREEKRKRFGVTFLNCLVWLFLIILVVASTGIVLLIYGISWVINVMLSEYNVRKLQAIGTTASRDQFPEILDALTRVCEMFGVKKPPRVIILSDSHVNAFALKFARKRVIVLVSQTLEGVLDSPEELRFFLGHEVAHLLLDHGARGMFEIYKPASYKAARELTCDNCGSMAAGNPQAATNALKRAGVGNQLVSRLNDESLISEAGYIYSGLTGWLVKQQLSYPPLGTRIQNIKAFCQTGPGR